MELAAAAEARLGEINAALRNGDFSAGELMDFFTARARARESLNAFITLDEARARAAADAVSPAAGPLAGAPTALKDIFCTKAIRTTCASGMLADYRPPYDSEVARRIRAADMPLMGKTNMDEFAMGSSGEFSHFGATRNPWDPKRVAGGSSSGSAAAVAARLAPLAFGTDTGGSIRQPAAFCGVCGIKPTYGRISRWGMIAFASSFDQAGIIAKSAADLALALQVAAGFDARDSTSLDAPGEDYAAALERPLKGRAVGVPVEFFGEGLDSEAEDAVRAALEELARLGAEIKEVSLPSLRLAIPAYYVLSSAEASSNLSRYDGARFGHRAKEWRTWEEMFENSRGEGFGGEVKRRILIGGYVLSYGYYDAYYRRAQKIRHRIADDFARAFADCEIIAGPTAPSAAFALGEICDDPVRMYKNDIYTVPVNLAGLPALSIPCGFNRAGLPLGLQLIGGFLREADILNFAHQYQRRADWHRRAPPEED